MSCMKPAKKGVGIAMLIGAQGHRTKNYNSELAIKLPTCTAIASKASLNRPDKTTPTTAAATKQTALTNIKTQNNK